MGRVVHAQLATALDAFFARDVALAGKVIDKDDHVDNLLGWIEETCFARLAQLGADASPGLREIRGAFRVAVNFEKIGDYAVNIAEQAIHVSRFGTRPSPYDLGDAGRAALAALEEVQTAVIESSARKAKRACRFETRLDAHYREALEATFRGLEHGHDEPAFVITHLFVAKFLERLGDSILNIGETVLFTLTGERMKLHQYLHLEEMKGALSPEPGATAAVDFHQIWGGISGARVGRISVDGKAAFIWKEGTERKIEAEVREMTEWNRVRPGLVPDVLTRYQDGGRESFLGHFLDGVLLRDVYLTATWAEKARVTTRLLDTLREVWTATLHAQTPAISYVRQIRDRLAEVYGFHPELATLRRTPTRVFGIEHASVEDLLHRVEALEPALAPKVSVRIHGDFNTNNVILNPRTDALHFIDVHRSGRGDYLQDLGVLLVSLVRNPLGERRLNADMERLEALIIEFGAGFAAHIADTQFERRLMLSRARSFVTSARVVTEPDFARVLYLRGVRLLERLATGAP
jgi:phosphate uptake regulator/aminoglycoside phosphotransferase (APT) family kinase protein